MRNLRKRYSRRTESWSTSDFEAEIPVDLRSVVETNETFHLERVRMTLSIDGLCAWMCLRIQVAFERKKQESIETVNYKVDRRLEGPPCKRSRVHMLVHVNGQQAKTKSLTSTLASEMSIPWMLMILERCYIHSKHCKYCA